MKLYKQSLQNSHLADSYLATRGLKPDSSIGYDSYKGKDSLFLPIYNALGNLVMVEIRSIQDKQYTKLPKPNYSGHYIFNINKAILNEEYIVVTEGTIDCLSLTQQGINSIALLRATAPESTLHLLGYWKHIYLALDNDSVGVENTKRIMSFLTKYYDSLCEVDTIEYYEKDPNECLTSGNISQIVKQIKEIKGHA